MRFAPSIMMFLLGGIWLDSATGAGNSPWAFTVRQDMPHGSVLAQRWRCEPQRNGGLSCSVSEVSFTAPLCVITSWTVNQIQFDVSGAGRWRHIDEIPCVRIATTLEAENGVLERLSVVKSPISCPFPDPILLMPEEWKTVSLLEVENQCRKIRLLP